MRRSALLCVVAGVAVFAAGCSSDQKPGPMEPAAELAPAQGDQSNLALRCRDNGLIVVQLAGILSPRPPARLFQKAIQKFALVEFALLLRKKSLAQARALDLIDFLVDNRDNLINANTPLTLTRLGNVTDAILCIVGLEPTGVVLGPNTGIGVVPANNPDPVIITTPQGTVGLRVPQGGAPSQDVSGNTIPGVVVTVTGLGSSPSNTPLDPLNTLLDQFGQTVELTASQDVIWGAQEGGVTVAICVTVDNDFGLFDRLRLGHEGGLPETPKFGAIEILPQADGENVTAIVEDCGVPAPIGARSAFDGLRQLAKRVFLPEPLYATALLDKAGGVGGTTRKFSKFGAVDPELALEALPTSTEGTAGAPVAQPPSVLVRTQTLETPIPGIEVGFQTSPGTIAPATVTTNSDGVAATTSWVLGLGETTAIATPVAPVSEITFTPTSETFTAQGAPAAPDFGAADWSYLIQNATPENTAWTALAWPVTQPGWQQATAPFGSVGIGGTSPSGCADQAPTNWPVNKVILLRRDMFIPSGTTSIAISVKIDNDIRVFLNGTDVSGGTKSHEGCAETNLLTPFTVNASPGGPLIPGVVNRLAVLGIDRGVESFVDVKVTVTP